MSSNVDRPLRVAAFTGGVNVPCARFRVRQYILALAAKGIAIEESWPKLTSFPPRRHWLRPAWAVGTMTERLPAIINGWGADLTLLQREMVSTLATLEGFTRKPRLLDVDDAIHLYRDGRAARRLGSLADRVVVGNAWLAEIWSSWNPAIEILPTGVDTDLYRPCPFPERPVIGWIGSGSNVHYVELIADALGIIATRFPDASLLVCGDRPPGKLPIPVTFLPWSPIAERQFFEAISIGIMPLKDDDWERGKCSLKMLQYMAANRPCVVSPVGMNRQILAQREVGFGASTIMQWVDSLSALLREPDLATAMGERGRGLAVSDYSVTALAPRLATIIRKLV